MALDLKRRPRGARVRERVALRLAPWLDPWYTPARVPYEERLAIRVRHIVPDRRG